MRWVVLLSLSACSYSHGVAPPDAAPPDTPPDTPPITWSVDATSGKAVPATAAEWADFIIARQLGIAPPNSLWLMQEPSGSLQDSIGSVVLDSQGSPATYQQTVAGWSRRALKSSDGSGVVFYNRTDAALPNVGTTSMTVLMMYANESTPGITRTILIGGCCAGFATLSIDAANHFTVSMNTTGTATGQIDHGTGVVPIVFKLDRTNNRQAVITNMETIAPMNTQLGPYPGVNIGASNMAAPDGRWLYMAAWYGANAEMSDATIKALISALGW